MGARVSVRFLVAGSIPGAANMKQHTKTFLGMIAAQAICLALGLWVEVRFVMPMATSAGNPTHTVLAEREGADRSADDGPGTPSRSAILETPHTGTRILIFLWIASLQSFVAYLILSRVGVETSRRELRATKQSIRRQSDLLRTRDAVIFGLAKLAESRDPETGNHLERISLYSTFLASALRHDPKYGRQVTASFVKLIGISSALHDIGKVGVRDAILRKPGELTAEERVEMQEHASIGGRCISEIEGRLGNSNFLTLAREIACCHHECWDGSGYPQGLCHEEIPLAARIVAIADVYDALSSKRIYKDAVPHEKCVEMISAEAAKQFDPGLVDVFLRVETEFRDIARRCADTFDPPVAEMAPRDQFQRDAKVASSPHIETLAPGEGAENAPMEAALLSG
jgi:HD-GYP domain-containing protein (c-di-GMP phosphodiesterase class II)